MLRGLIEAAPYTPIDGGASETLKLCSGETFLKIGVMPEADDVREEATIQAEAHKRCPDHVPKVIAAGEILGHEVLALYPDAGKKLKSLQRDTPCFFMATKNIEGQLAGDALDRMESLPARARLLVRIFEAVQKLSECKVVHQDCKMDNIIIEHGTSAVYFVDFELSVCSGFINKGCIGYYEPHNFQKEYTPELGRSDTFTLLRSAKRYFSYLGAYAKLCRTTTGAHPGILNTYCHPDSKGWGDVMTPGEALAAVQEFAASLNKVPKEEIGQNV